jgi:NAD(P)-dependent dehydrogenase (short-subunit alcohol dehydrogenase family)
LNGFGEASVIEHERGKLATKFGVVKVSFNGADLSKPTEVSKMIEAATLELGQVDILVNNAGIQHTAPVEQFPIDHTSGRRRYLSAAQPVRRCVRTGAGYVEKPNDSKLIESAINGMLAGLDPHSSYMDPKSFRDMQVQTRVASASK